MISTRKNTVVRENMDTRRHFFPKNKQFYLTEKMFTGPLVNRTFFPSEYRIISCPIRNTKKAQGIGESIQWILALGLKFSEVASYIWWSVSAALARDHVNTLCSLTRIKLRLHFEMYRFVANFVEYSYCPPANSLGKWSVLCRSYQNVGNLFGTVTSRNSDYFWEQNYCYLRNALLLCPGPPLVPAPWWLLSPPENLLVHRYV